eukprot:7624883-Alexandrium_andersonii.AAC.1
MCIRDRPVPTGGNPNPAGSPPVSTGVAATGGAGQWAAEEWARWRSGAWYGPGQSSQAWGWSASAD